MKKKIIIILISLVFLGSVFYFWKHRYEYFFRGDLDLGEREEEKIKNELDSDESIYLEDEEDMDEFDENKDGDEESFENSYDYELSEKPLSDIVAEDCSNDCENQKGEDGYEYCLEICGLNEKQEYPNENECEKMLGLKKDNCFRNRAILQKDFSFCEEIEDENLQEACRNRVSEEIIDAQKLE